MRKLTFHLKVLLLMSILGCSELSHTTNFIHARDVKTVRNVEPVIWSNISSLGCGFLVLDLAF